MWPGFTDIDLDIHLLFFPDTSGVACFFFVRRNHHFVEKYSVKILKVAITVFFLLALPKADPLVKSTSWPSTSRAWPTGRDHWIARYASRRRRRCLRRPVVAQQSCVWERKKSNKCEDILYLTTYNLGAITTDLKSANYVKIILHKYKSLERTKNTAQLLVLQLWTKDWSVKLCQVAYGFFTGT